MEVNFYRDDLVINWINNLEDVICIEYDILEERIEVYITSKDGLLTAIVPLNTYENIIIFFRNRHLDIYFKGDISICETIANVINKFKHKVFCLD